MYKYSLKFIRIVNHENKLKNEQEFIYRGLLNAFVIKPNSELTLQPFKRNGDNNQGIKNEFNQFERDLFIQYGLVQFI